MNTDSDSARESDGDTHRALEVNASEEPVAQVLDLSPQTNSTAGLPSEVDARQEREDESTDDESLRRRIRVKANRTTSNVHQLQETSESARQRRRLVQESDDSESGAHDTITSSSAADVAQSISFRESSKQERRNSLQALANQRKLTDNNETSSSDNESRQSKPNLVSRTKAAPTSKSTYAGSGSLKKKEHTHKASDIEARLGSEVMRLVASAALNDDLSYTKKMCREQLCEKFGVQQLERHINFFRQEFQKASMACEAATKDELRSMAAMNSGQRASDDEVVSSDLDAPIQAPRKKGADAPSYRKQAHDDKPRAEKMNVKQKMHSSRARSNLKKNTAIKPKDVKSHIGREVIRRIASAALNDDLSYTKKMCKEQLCEKFGVQQLERHIDFFRQEFDKASMACMTATKDELRSMVAMNIGDGEFEAHVADDEDFSSDLDAPLGSNGRSLQTGKKRVREGKAVLIKEKKTQHDKVEKARKDKKSQHNKLEEARANRESREKGKLDMYTLHLERIIASASINDDKSLTKKTCREKLQVALGLSTLDPDLEYINKEIGRITLLCMQTDADSVRSMAERQVPPNALDFFLPTAGNRSESEQSDSHSDHESDGASSSSSLDTPASKKSKNGRASGILSGMIIAPCGKEFLKNELVLQKFRELVQSHGAKVQSCVTRKVQYVVVANGGFLKSKDTRVASARKHGAKIVMESFFEECIQQQCIVNVADHIAVHSDSRPANRKTANKIQDSSLLPDESGRAEPDAGEAMDDDGSLSPSLHKSKRVIVRRSKEENEWTKDVKAKFSYVKDARSRPYEAKDPVVSGASFVTEKGLLYNTYLTHTDFENGEEAQTKFFAIKLVEAGGLMKGERWHVVTQWGKVGATKPGCDVTDFDDYDTAVEVFKQRFYEKTKNSWDSSAFAFRTVSGKYTMEELSEDEDQEHSSADEDEFPSRLDIRVQNLISRLFSTKTVDQILQSLGFDTAKLNFRRLKGSVVRESFAALMSIQKILQKGEAARNSEKDVQRIKSQTDRLHHLLHLNSYESETIPINSVTALQEKIRIVDELQSVLVLTTIKKRCLLSLSATSSRLDAFYCGLRCHINPMSATGDQYHFISKMMYDTASADEHKFVFPRLLNLHSVSRAGEDGRYAAFSVLDNKLLLWRAVRATGLASVLLQGMCTAAPEAPAVGFPLGKGLYFYDSAAEAFSASGFCENAPPDFLVLCEVALGTSHECIRPSYIQRAPHGYHSVIAKGVFSYDPLHRVPFLGEHEPHAVIGPPQRSFGAKESSFKFNQFVVYDVGQVKIRFICQLDVHSSFALD